MNVLAIDPGPVESAYALIHMNTFKILSFGKVDNFRLMDIIRDLEYSEAAIEMVASYGIPAGKTLYETAFWIGRFWQLIIQKACPCKKIYRKEDVCMNLCYTTRAKDPNIRQALIDRFGDTGTKKNPGWFYGVSKDVWSAIAVGVTYIDKFRGRGDF